MRCCANPLQMSDECGDVSMQQGRLQLLMVPGCTVNCVKQLYTTEVARCRVRGNAARCN
jgi:hypothetical protein